MLTHTAALTHPLQGGKLRQMEHKQVNNEITTQFSSRMLHRSHIVALSKVVLIPSDTALSHRASNSSRPALSLSQSLTELSATIKCVFFSPHSSDKSEKAGLSSYAATACGVVPVETGGPSARVSPHASGVQLTHQLS